MKLPRGLPPGLAKRALQQIATIKLVGILDAIEADPSEEAESRRISAARIASRLISNIRMRSGSRDARYRTPE